MKFQKPGNKSKQKPQKGHTQKPRNYNVIKLNSDTGDQKTMGKYLENSDRK